jgi:hypothetical protein
MKFSTVLPFLLFLSGIVIFLIQLWFQVWGPELFIKIMITNGAFFIISLVLSFLIKEKRASDRMNKSGSGLD